jgi:acetoin utilization protein AcuB
VIAKTLIHSLITPLHPTDTGKFALQQMQDYHVQHLPIVVEGELIGLISDEMILHYDTARTIESYPLPSPRFCVRETKHLYEILPLVVDYQLSTIPVLDEDEHYIGLITQVDLLQAFASTTALSEEGTVLVLETNRYNYSLAALARIIEAEGALILSSYVTSSLESTQLEITLKINTPSITRIISTLERFNYELKGSYNENDFQENLQERYDGLMSYLNV